MRQVVFLPGLGADQRLFNFIATNKYNTHFINWDKPKENESMHSYVKRIMESIKFHEPPVLVGVSLGGMLAMELRELIPVKKTILISSVKAKSEMPVYFSLLKKSMLHQIVPVSVIKKSAILLKPFISDPRNKDAMQLFKMMVNESDDDFIKWALQLVMEWERTDCNKDNLIHIHGTKDLVFPLKNIKNCDYIIEGGKHDMIMTNASEINKILEYEILN
jgi:pimeloyl-ACP methyl ester carboxylesterase